MKKKLTVLIVGMFLALSTLAFSGCAKKPTAKPAPAAPAAPTVPSKKAAAKVAAAKKTAAAKK